MFSFDCVSIGKEPVTGQLPYPRDGATEVYGVEKDVVLCLWDLIAIGVLFSPVYHSTISVQQRHYKEAMVYI